MTYLGPLGGLTQIHPLTEIETTSTREGGTHTPLSGRKVVDYLGNRAQFKMKFRRQTSDEMAFLEALHHRHIRGPLRLVLDSLKKNRLSRSAASVGFAGRDTHGVQLTAGSIGASDLWPSEAPPAGQSLKWIGSGDGDAVRFDRNDSAPVLPGESLNGSLYVRSGFADTVRLVLDENQGDSYSGSVSGPDTTLTANTWTRLDVPYTQSGGTVGVSLALLLVTKADASSEPLIAAPQVETGDTATAWQLGGGAPIVSVGQMPTSSPYVPLTIPELTLMEL